MEPITININLHLQDKQVDTICSTLACFAQIIDNAAHTMAVPSPAVPVPQSAEKTDHEPEVETEESPKPTHTHEDVRNLYITLTHQGKKAEASKIIRKYAAKVPEIPENALNTVYAELEGLSDDTAA